MSSNNNNTDRLALFASFLSLLSSIIFFSIALRLVTEGGSEDIIVG